MTQQSDVPFSTDPVPQLVIDYVHEVVDRPAHVEEQIDAYRIFCKRFNDETNSLRRAIMQNLLNYVVHNEPAMKPTYAFDELLDNLFVYEKAAERKLFPRELYQIVTDVVRHSVHTKGRGRSRNWTVHRGSNGYGRSEGSKRPNYNDWTATELKGAHLLFGSHVFSVGTVAEDVLKAIEERYGLNFRKLESERKKAQRAKK